MATSLTVGRTYLVRPNRSNNLRTGERVVYMGTEPGPDTIGGERVTTNPDWKPGDPIGPIGNLYQQPRPEPWVTLVNPDWLQETTPLEVGQIARITSQNSQTNLSEGTRVVLVRRHLNDSKVWVVSADLTVTPETARGVRVRLSGLLRYAQEDILTTDGVEQPRAVPDVPATTTPEPAPGVKVRTDDEHGSHEFPRGTVVTLVRRYTENLEEPFWLATGADWSPGQPEPEWTTASYRDDRNSTRYIETGHFTVLPVDITEESTVHNPSFPAQVPGAKFTVTGTTSESEPIERGSTVTFVRNHAWRADLCVVSTRDWAPGQNAPTGQGGDDVRSADGFYYASRSALTLVETPAPAPTYLEREVRQGDLAEVIRPSGGTSHSAPAGTRVRVVRRNIMTSFKWLVSTNLDDTEHSTRGRSVSGEDGGLYWANTDDLRVVTEEPVAATPLVAAPGVKARIVSSTGLYGHHGFPIGTEVTIVRPSNGMSGGETCDWRVVVGDWSPGQEEPRQTNVDTARRADIGASRLVLTEEIEVIQPVTGHDETVSEGDALRAERDAAVKALADFKQKVREVATKEATDRGWCTEIDEVLENIEPGLTRIKRYTRVMRTVEITYTVEQDGSTDDVLVDLAAFVGLDAIRGAHHNRVATLSARWSGTPTRTTINEADLVGTAPTAQPVTLSAATLPAVGTRLRVLEGAHRFNSYGRATTENVPAVGEIVTLGSRSVDADGDVSVNGSNTGNYVQPQFLTLAD